jgi:hypothetical protein
MKAFFKDNDKLIINSFDHNERLVGETFLDAYSKGYTLKVESRNDVNDDFDGLVLTLVEPTPEPTPEPTSDTTQDSEEEQVVEPEG